MKRKKSRIGLGSINNMHSKFKKEGNGEDCKKKSDVRRAVICMRGASEREWAVSRKVNRQTCMEKKDGTGSEISNI